CVSPFQTIHRLAAHTAYIFRIAAQSDHGQSPFSDPSAILSTRPTAPCQAPTHVRTKLVHMNLDKLLLKDEAINPPGTHEVCHKVLVQWKPILDEEWNGKPQFYQIFYRRWSESEKSVDQTILITAMLQNRTMEAYLPPLIPNTYYEVSLAAWSSGGVGPKTTPILVHSGEGCLFQGRKNERLTHEHIETTSENSIHYMEPFVNGFHCSSNTEFIEIS
ncbi:hypothetical protein AHF37_10925, partial [Paragonimus kellicotti]